MQLTVCDDDRVVAFYGFIHDSFRKVDSEKDGVHLPAQRVEGRLEEHCDALAQVLK